MHCLSSIQDKGDTVIGEATRPAKQQLQKLSKDVEAESEKAERGMEKEREREGELCIKSST